VFEAVFWGDFHAVDFEVFPLSEAKLAEAAFAPEALDPMQDVVDRRSSRLVREDDSDHMLRYCLSVDSHQVLDAAHDHLQVQGAIVHRHSYGLRHPPRDQQQLLEAQQLQHFDQVYFGAEIEPFALGHSRQRDQRPHTHKSSDFPLEGRMHAQGQQ